MILLLLCGFAHAESAESILEQSGMDALIDAVGFDVKALAEKLLSGEWSVDEAQIEEGLKRLGAAVRSGLLDILTALAAPILASLAVRALLGGDGGALSLLCRLSVATLLMGRFVEARATCEAALRGTLKLVNAASPVLISALTLTGSAERAAILTPSTALCASLIEGLLANMALPLCGVAAVVAASANLSERFQLNRLFDVMKRSLTWGMGLLLSGFVGLMAIQGLLVGGQDGLSARAIQRALRSALPIVGTEVSDSAGALLASALSVRNLAGLAGMIAVLAASMAPILKLAASTIALRLASAVLEPLSDPCVTKTIGHFGSLVRMLLEICVSGTLLAVLVLGACLSLAG